MPDDVPATEFTRNFGRYRMAAQRSPVAVSSHGQITGYFLGPAEYEEFQRYKNRRQVFLTVDLPEERLQEILESRMDPRHDHLNSLLEEDE
jgi:hypothetical protein